MKFTEKTLKFLLFLFILSLIAGQLTRFEVSQGQVAFYLHDIFLILLIIVSLIYFFGFKKKLLLPKNSILILIFILVAIISQLNSLRLFSATQILIGSLFIVRFSAFFFLYLIFFNLIPKKQLTSWFYLLITVGAILAVVGFFQLLFFYDLRFLTEFGYDPHFGRLVSTFLDPNFFGGFQIIVLNLAIAAFLDKKNKKLLPILVILFLSIILTFSRSSYLALFVAIFLFGLLKSKKLPITVILAFVFLIPFLPRILERILGAVTFDVTAQARVSSWFQALQIFLVNPILGVGFNNLRAARVEFGFLQIPQGLGGHSGAGVDSAFLQILATTGIVGFLVFLLFYFLVIYQKFAEKKNFYSLATLITLVALFVHSQFVNSLFFPQVAAFFWLSLAISDVSNKT